MSNQRGKGKMDKVNTKLHQKSIQIYVPTRSPNPGLLELNGCCFSLFDTKEIKILLSCPKH